MNKLILLRHGQSQWNLENKFTGWKDVNLTNQGIAEAQEAGNLLSTIEFDYAFTSDLKRAQDTFQLILNHNLSNPAVTKSFALNERDYGDLIGQNKKEAALKFGEEQVQKWRRSYDVPPPNGESLEMTYNRTIPYFQKNILPLINNNNIIISAHGNSLRAIIMYLFNYSKNEILKTEIGWCEPCVINYKNNKPVSYELILRSKTESMSNFPRNPFL